MSKKKAKDLRPALRDVQREKDAIHARLYDGKAKEPFVNGYLCGMDAALAWMQYSSDGFSPPTQMLDVLLSMLAAAKSEQRRRKKQRRG